MGITVKSASSIKSLASLKKSGSHSGERHVHYFKVASLELERSRRLKERQDAVERIRSIDQRLLEIEALLDGHHETLGLAAPGADNSEEVAGTPRAYDAPRPGRTLMVEERPAAPHHSGPRQMLVYGR